MATTATATGPLLTITKSPASKTTTTTTTTSTAKKKKNDDDDGTSAASSSSSTATKKSIRGSNKSSKINNRGKCRDCQCFYPRRDLIAMDPCQCHFCKDCVLEYLLEMRMASSSIIMLSCCACGIPITNLNFERVRGERQMITRRRKQDLNTTKRTIPVVRKKKFSRTNNDEDDDDDKPKKLYPVRSALLPQVLRQGPNADGAVDVDKDDNDDDEYVTDSTATKLVPAVINGMKVEVSVPVDGDEEELGLLLDENTKKQKETTARTTEKESRNDKLVPLAPAEVDMDIDDDTNNNRNHDKPVRDQVQEEAVIEGSVAPTVATGHEAGINTRLAAIEGGDQEKKVSASVAGADDSNSRLVVKESMIHLMQSGLTTMRNAPTTITIDMNQVPAAVLAKQLKVPKKKGRPKKAFKKETYRKRRLTFDERYLGLLAFKVQHGHCRVPWRYGKVEAELEIGANAAAAACRDSSIVSIGDDQPEQQIEIAKKCQDGLGEWVKNIRRGIKRISLDDRKRLNKIGFVWETKYNRYDREWNEKLLRLKLYKRRFGDCSVPFNWEEDRPLYEWVNTQRKLEKKGELREDRKGVLNELGFAWRGKGGVVHMRNRRTIISASSSTTTNVDSTTTAGAGAAASSSQDHYPHQHQQQQQLHHHHHYHHYNETMNHHTMGFPVGTTTTTTAAAVAGSAAVDEEEEDDDDDDDDDDEIYSPYRNWKELLAQTHHYSRTGNASRI